MCLQLYHLILKQCTSPHHFKALHVVTGQAPCSRGAPCRVRQRIACRRCGRRCRPGRGRRGQHSDERFGVDCGGLELEPCDTVDGKRDVGVQVGREPFYKPLNVG